ncbi:MAG: hypothetical protein AAGF71_13960 [Pseudomonadota bacterium]
MPDLTFALYRFEIPADGQVTIPGSGAAAVLAHSGGLSINGEVLSEGCGVFTAGGAIIGAVAPAVALVFVLSEGPADPAALRTETIAVRFPCLLRLDEVAFPPGAQAFRHVHPGPGFRHLRWGQLRLEADDHAFIASPGDTWFEPEQSPVKATASDTETETRFVRCMVLPPEFEGKPTIQILDPEDAKRPKRQVTHRHLDQVLENLAQGDAG